MFRARTNHSQPELTCPSWGTLLRLPNRIIIFLITIYQKAVSPWLPRSCRFQPTCSAYGLAAFRKFPLHRALYLTLWRIIRCNPFCKGGYDPLP